MRGADGSNAGASGYAPAPAATDNNKALFGDGAYRAVTTTGTAATKAEADAGTDTTKYVAPDALAYALAAKRNALAPRGGLAFDGSAALLYNTLGSPGNIGASDPFSLHLTVEVPLTSPSSTKVIFWSSVDSTNPTGVASSNFMVAFYSGGYLGVSWRDPSNRGSAARDWSFASFVSTYGGKRVQLTITRTSSSVATMYVNGVALSPTTTTDTLFSSYASNISGYSGISCGIGYLASTVYSASLYNLALAQSDITEIYESGGAVPERFKFGSQVSYAYASSISFNGSGQTALSTLPPQARKPGAKALITGTASASAGTSYVTYNGGGGEQGAIIANGAFSLIIATTSNFLGQIVMYNAAVNIASLRVVALGAVVHYDADADCIGYQLHDQGTNKLHALLITTSPTWTKQATMGYVKVLSDGTTSAQTLGGGTILPANCQIIRVRARSISGTPSITLGTSSGGSQIVASVALSTTWKDLTIALTGGINTAANSLYMTASTGNVVEVQIAYEQLPA